MTCRIDSNWSDHCSAPEAFREQNRKARMFHQCCECGRKIIPGEVYRYESGIWEGAWDAHKTCLDCLSVRDALFCSFVYESLWESVYAFIIDSQNDLPWAEFAKLTPAAREKVLERVEELFEEDD